VKLVWDEAAWDDYIWWQQQDRKVLKRINTLIADIQRNGNEGIGKPEPLKHGFQGTGPAASPTSTGLVYKVIDDQIRIAACRYTTSTDRTHGAALSNIQLHHRGCTQRTLEIGGWLVQVLGGCRADGRCCEELSMISAAPVGDDGS